MVNTEIMPNPLDLTRSLYIKYYFDPLTPPGDTTVYPFYNSFRIDVSTILATCDTCSGVLFRNTNNTSDGSKITISNLDSNNETQLVVTLDRTISGLGNPSENFAIFRPKPDETSVIINFKKDDGEVSQTILIPQDASDELKNNVGEIYQKLNVDLSNQNIS
jgi:hypothetical protein